MANALIHISETGELQHQRIQTQMQTMVSTRKPLKNLVDTNYISNSIKHQSCAEAHNPVDEMPMGGQDDTLPIFEIVYDGCRKARVQRPSERFHITEKSFISEVDPTKNYRTGTPLCCASQKKARHSIQTVHFAVYPDLRRMPALW